jgi:hypothetical protein
MNKEKESICLDGFWFHIEWSENGTGRDQRGAKWKRYPKPKCISLPLLKEETSSARKRIFSRKSWSH